MAFYQEIRYCIVPNPATLGNGICQNFDKYNTAGCGFDGDDCVEFNKEFPDCKAKYPIFLGDGRCDGGEYDTAECGWDGGDCDEFNKKYPDCAVEKPILVGNGVCDEEDEGAYNTEVCGWDGGDCLTFWENYPNCNVENPSLIGNGECDGGKYNTIECNYDDGDCNAFNSKYPNCAVENPWRIGDGYCQPGKYNTIECGWDGGDCETFNTYPNCTVEDPGWIGDGRCNGGKYNTFECGWDGGDCETFNGAYINCTVEDPYWIGDAYCDGGKYNTFECGWDGGDCETFNGAYPNCTVEDPTWFLGNGRCNGGKYNTFECGWDGGDCETFSAYPNCTVENPGWIGNGYCNGGKYNTFECGWDGGDCEISNADYPNCTVEDPSWIGDGSYCDGGKYNTFECGWDGGDCETFNADYPNCTVDNPGWIGDGECDAECDGSIYNTFECGWDGGDCETLFNADYPNCNVDNPGSIGNGVCDFGKYNTEDCGFDEGDCDNFNSEYTECFGVIRSELGDGICQHNTPGCNFDDGDCFVFSTLYPKCTADEPYSVGDGYCNEEYNTPECQLDGGDCMTNDASGILFINGERVSVEKYLEDTQAYALIQTITSTMSLIASIGIIWVICRTFKKLSVPFHRLLLGMCLSDIISSLALSFSTLPAPNSLDDVIWNAKGNKGSCQAQGFLIFLGSVAAPLYSCSLCIYYLIVVTYKKGKNPDAYIKGKIEFCLHAVPIFVSLIGATTILSMNAFHPNMTYCYIGADPTCDDLECDRRNGYANVLFIVFSAGPYFILPCVIFSTMAIMYRAVLAQEKKQQKFGIGALALRRNRNATNSKNNANTVAVLAEERNDDADFDEHQNKSTFSSIRKSLVRIKAWIASRTSNNNVVAGRNIRSNKSGKQSRAIMNRALSYALAFFFTYLFPIIISIRTLSGLESGPALSILARVFFPLQGFFNFLVFIYPKVEHAKNSSRGEGISWYKAFVKAIQSRGQRSRNRSGRILGSRSSATGRWLSKLSRSIGRIFEKMKRKSKNGSSRQAAVSNETETRKSTYIEKSNVEIVRPLRSSTKRTTSSQTPSSSTNYASNHTAGCRVRFAAGKSSCDDDAEVGLLTFLPTADGDTAVLEEPKMKSNKNGEETMMK